MILSLYLYFYFFKNSLYLLNEDIQDLIFIFCCYIHIFPLYLYLCYCIHFYFQLFYIYVIIYVKWFYIYIFYIGLFYIVYIRSSDIDISGWINWFLFLFWAPTKKIQRWNHLFYFIVFYVFFGINPDWLIFFFTNTC